MNSKLLIIGLMISSVLAVSVSAQKITPAVQQVTLQDDQTGDHFTFTIADGTYQFESCKGNFKAEGVGIVTITGCTIDLQDISDTRRVLAEVNLCDKAGKADIAFEGDRSTDKSDTGTFEVVISDSNTTDSAFKCEGKPIELK
jgi:hypothetical protein